MKKSLVLAMALAMGVAASAYAANPFSDVPAGHWAYDSIDKLAAAGVVDGYGDGSYRGDKLMTRYEMAQIIARAMAKGANVDRLAAEFADELDALGVRVAALEKKADNVKITGQIRYHYWDKDTGASESSLRSRIWIKGQINKDWTYTGMLENIQKFRDDVGNEDTDFQRAFVNGRIGGVKVQAGRDNLAVLLGGEILSNRADFVKLSYGKEVSLDVLGGKLANKTTGTPFGEDFYAAVLGAKLGPVDAHITYIDIDNQSTFNSSPEDNNILAIDVAANLAKDVKLSVAGLWADAEDTVGNDTGWIVKLNYAGAKASKPGSWGAWAQYSDMAGSTYIARGFESTLQNDSQYKRQGYKGYQIGVNYTFAKNIVGQIEYTDLEVKDGAKYDNNSIWSELVFSF